MEISMLKSKIHRAVITQAELNYVGSITIDEALMEAAGLYEYERVHISNVNSGSRIETYVIAGERAGIMMEITQLLLSMKVNTKYLSAKSSGKTVDITITFDIKDSEQLQTIIRSITKLDSVITVDRTNQK